MKSLKILSLTLMAIVMAALFAPAASAFGIPVTFTELAAISIGTSLVLPFLNFNAVGLMFADTITTTQLATELKAFFKVEAGLPASWVYAKDVQLNKFARRITKVKGQYMAPHAIMTNVIQGFEAVWNEMGTTKIKSNELTSYRCKVNFPINPDEIEGTYLAWANEEGKDQADRSISRFIAETLKEKAIDDLDELSINGEYDANNLDVFGKAINGIVKILTDGVAETVAQTAKNPMYLVPLDPLTENNMVEQVTAFEKAVPKRLKRFIKRIYMGTDKLEDYMLDYEDTLGTIQSYNDTKKARTRLNGWEIVGLDKLNGSDLIFTTPDNNLLQLIDLFDKPTITKIEDFEYTVKLYMSFWLGYGFYYNQMVFVSHNGSETGYNDSTTTADYIPEELTSGSGI